MAFTYDLSTEIRPTSGPPGGTITLTAKFSNASEPVVKAFATVRMYGYFIALARRPMTPSSTPAQFLRSTSWKIRNSCHSKAEDGTSVKISFK